MEEKKSFLGTGWSFPVKFSKGSKQAHFSEGEKDIQESLIILLSTSLGERVMRPDFGANMEDMLFEALNVTTASIISNRIKKAILFHEPRVKVEDINLRPNYNEGRVEVLIEYTIISTNNRRNLVYPYLITEATDIKP